MPKYQKSFEIDYHGEKVFTVAIYDLTAAPTDCIVSPSNGALSPGGGLANQIFDEAGSELEEECERYYKKNGKIPVTQVAITSSGRLGFKGILHAVGPRKIEEDYTLKLKNTFHNCLELAENQNWQSIGFPAISTGIYGISREECAKAIKSAIDEFWNEYSNTNIKQIILCLPPREFDDFEKVLNNQESQDMNSATPEINIKEIETAVVDVKELDTSTDELTESWFNK